MCRGDPGSVASFIQMEWEMIIIICDMYIGAMEDKYKSQKELEQ